MKEGIGMKFKLAKLFTHTKGFTLIEVMSSILIFSILTLGMLTVFSQAMNYTQKSKNDTIGIYAARNMMNYMEQKDFTQMNQYVTPLTTDSGSKKVLEKNICLDWYPKEDTNNDGLDDNEELRERCEATFTPSINNREFLVKVELSKHQDGELQDSLIPIKVIVNWEDDNESTLEGFITHEEYR